MAHREASPTATLSLRLLLLILCVSVPASRLAARTRTAALDSSYVTALAAADHFLQAWQSGDVESGMSLLTGQAKQLATTDAVEKFFSGADASAYEIGRGKLLKRDHYEFPVVLVIGSAGTTHLRRRFSSIIVVNTGNNDWAVDKLP
jgi:hypothetical protein